MTAERITPEWAAGSERAKAAYALAGEAHAGQTAKDRRTPYIVHPVAVADRVAADGVDEDVLVAALLHDAVESSELELDAVAARFGAKVCELVSALTDDMTIEDYAERKREHRARVADAGAPAAVIYAADKLVNARELRGLHAELGEAAAERLQVSIDLRVTLWQEDLEMLREVLGDDALVAELRDELDALEAERPSVQRATAP